MFGLNFANAMSNDLVKGLIPTGAQKPSTPQEVMQILKDVMAKHNIGLDAIAKSVLVENAMTSSGTAPQDLARAMRVQNALLRNGASSGVVSRTIHETLKTFPADKALMDSMKNALQEYAQVINIHMNIHMNIHSI